MKISRHWLRDFVPAELSATELRDLLTARVATVDAVEPLRADLASFVVARVVECGRHPDSDHLSVTKVDDGSGALVDVVCGAPNVRAGATYPFARVGTIMPGGLKIEKRKIRGATSQGMLCSARELGLGEDSDGILELTTDASPGTPLLSVLDVGDVRLEVDVLPNRPDLLSHLGVAREVAAATGTRLDPLAGRGPQLDADAERELRAASAEGADAVAALYERWATSGARVLPAGASTLAPSGWSDAEILAGKAGDITVRLEDPAGAPRYLGAVIRGVRVGESPAWLRERIEAIGSRSINNVVDVTNYMLHGMGQPMHAFDAKRLAGNTVVIRRARAGERITLLDGSERTLDASMLVIADAERAQAIAGVMGGHDSEVGPETTDVFLEVAAFEPASVRRTRRALGLSTDASYRFERGTDARSADLWLAHAAHLITEVAGGAVDPNYADVHARPTAPAAIRLRGDRVSRLLGESIRAAEIRSLLESIGFEVEVTPGTEMLHQQEELLVTPPSWRSDIRREADLAEEIARLRGFDSFSSELRPFRAGTVPDAEGHLIARRMRELLCGLGLLEVRPMPFVPGSDERHVRVSNPLAETEAHLRREVLESLARVAEYNLARMQGNVRLFEVGTAFLPAEGRPREELRVAALVMGLRRPPHFTEPKPPAFDEWDARGIAERILEVMGSGATIRASRESLWDVVAGDEIIGTIRRVPLDAPPWASPGFGVEIRLQVVETADVAPRGRHDYARRPASASASASAERRQYVPLPVTPPAEFDLALIVPDGRMAADVEGVIRGAAGELLERLELFDEFRGAGIPENARSLAWRLTFRHPERTLREKEIEGRRRKILDTLESELGIRPRA